MIWMFLFRYSGSREARTSDLQRLIGYPEIPGLALRAIPE